MDGSVNRSIRRKFLWNLILRMDRLTEEKIRKDKLPIRWVFTLEKVLSAATDRVEDVMELEFLDTYIIRATFPNIVPKGNYPHIVKLMNQFAEANECQIAHLKLDSKRRPVVLIHMKRIYLLKETNPMLKDEN